MVDFTVAIPTYNGEQRLPAVLERLRSQIIPTDFSWEVIVVDNNSHDRTSQIVTAFQSNFPCPLRYCLELQQGAAYARKRALSEAASELIGFLDDDNLPDSNWVTAAYRFAQAHSRAGAYGSQIQGEFEVAPSPELKPLLPFLALTDRGSQPLRYEPQQKTLPPSAGLVVRKQAWMLSVPAVTTLGGRVEGNMLTGEDLEVLAHIQRSGWEIWYNPEMKITHIIPAWRLEAAYLIPFFRGIGLSRFVTRMAGIQPSQRSLAFVVYLVNDLRKILIHLLKYGWRVQSNLAAACERELIWNSLVSPFYLWKKGYLQKQ
ncbi:MAG TPA: hormogonium polysaccharide biosynthesis glycosyltransferase HpsE [Trichocoleus sp.]